MSYLWWGDTAGGGGEGVKTLTLLQPWASLVACGAKKIETRSWATKYRGPLAIHAAAFWNLELSSKLSHWEFQTGFLKSVSICKKLRPFCVSDLFVDKEQFDRMKGMRGIEFAYQGMRIEVAGKMGTIVGSNQSLNLDVVFDGSYYKSNCHPWWETVYFDRKGNVVADYRKKEEKA